jgi:hypothetical protein
MDRVRRVIRHPGRSVRRRAGRLAEEHRLPVGRTAQIRRLVAAALGDPQRVLVIGPPGAVRQALPDARLDVVGTDPHDAAVTVVSEAMGEGSLPRRWDCVVVTEAEPRDDRLIAAADACRPGGLVAVATSGGHHPAYQGIPGTTIEEVLGARAVRLIQFRVGS